MKLRQTSISKITKPRLPTIYARTRVFRLLDRSRRTPVAWITGPPGSSKTTLVASYFDNRKLPCLWSQVDQGDADISMFFYCMGLTAKKAAPRKHTSSSLLTLEYPPSTSLCSSCAVFYFLWNTVEGGSYEKPNV